MASYLQLYKNDLPDNIDIVGDIAVDTEAMGLKIGRDRLCLVQICDENKNVFMVHFPEEGYNYDAPNLRRLLMDESRKKILHYARFDIAILKHYLAIKEIKNLFCTKIASRLSRTYTESHGLKSLVGDLLGVELKKEQCSSHWGRPLSDAQKNYAKNDVFYLHELRSNLTEMLTNSNRIEIAQRYFDFINTVCDADLAGFEGDLFAHI